MECVAALGSRSTAARWRYPVRAAASPAGGEDAGSGAVAPDTELHTRVVPGSGEHIPVIGLGTYRTFDVRPGQSVDDQREVLRRFHAGGGRVVDTSPMYGEAERVVGLVADDLGITDSLFLATKIWTRGGAAGREQAQESARLLGRATIDLMQVHNLVDLRTQLATLTELRRDGHCRHVGVTHYLSSRHDDLAALVTSAPIDFVQVNYSLLERNAEHRLLPAAADHGVAVLVNQPFETSSLFGWVRDAALPDWAAELGIRSWAQYFLKFVLGHPAVTCVLPATRVPVHMDENLEAGRGPVPDEAMRRRMVEYFHEL